MVHLFRTMAVGGITMVIRPGDPREDRGGVINRPVMGLCASACILGMNEKDKSARARGG